MHEGEQPCWLFLSLPFQHLIIEPKKKKKIQQENPEELSLPSASGFSLLSSFFHFLEGVEEVCVEAFCRYCVHQNHVFFSL